MPTQVADVVPLAAWRRVPQPELAAGDLLLRPWRPDDVDVVVRAYADPAIAHWHVQTKTPEEAAAWIGSWPGRWHAGTGADWAVTDLAGDVVGRIGLSRIEPWAGQAWVAYWVLPEARGRHVAPRAVVALVGWLFAAHPFVRVELRHSTRNPASCAVADRAGFTLEGTLRAAGLHADGQHDMHVHARLTVDAPVPGAGTATGH